MIRKIKMLLTGSSRTRQDEDERARIAAREAVEKDLAALRERKDNAVGYLIPRQQRNHWSEAIGDMIRGTH